MPEPMITPVNAADGLCGSLKIMPANAEIERDIYMTHLSVMTYMYRYIG